MKRTCNGCRALEVVDYFHYRCQLLKKIVMVTAPGRHWQDPTPGEECSKPKTIPQFIKAMEGNKS